VVSSRQAQRDSDVRQTLGRFDVIQHPSRVLQSIADHLLNRLVDQFSAHSACAANRDCRQNSSLLVERDLSLPVLADDDSVVVYRTIHSNRKTKQTPLAKKRAF
jgi:hypothetical protein